MSERKTIFRSVISMLFMRVLTPTTTFLLFVYLSRKLGPSELGKYSFVIAVFQIVSSIPLLGLSPYVIREVARNKENAVPFMVNLSLIGLISSIALSVVLYVCFSKIGYPGDVVSAIGVLSFAIIIGSISQTGEAVLVGSEKIHQMSFVGIAENLLKTVFSFAGVWMGLGLIYLVLVIGVSKLFSAVSYLLMTKAGKFSWRLFIPDGSFCGQILRACPVFFGIGVFAALLNRLDFLMLSKMRTFDELGFYTAAYRILEICILLSSTFIFAIFPLITRIRCESPERFRFLVGKTAEYLFLLLMFMSVMIFIFADELVVLFYDEGYSASIFALRLLIPTALFIGLDQLFAAVLLAGNYQNLDLKVVLTSSVGYFILLLVLIPAFGINGACVATLLAGLVQVGLRYWWMSRKMLSLSLLKLICKPFVAGLIVIGTVFLLGDRFRFTNFPLAFIGYFGLLFAMGVLSRNDFILVWNLKGVRRETA